MVQKWIRRGVLFLAIIIFLVVGMLLFLHTATGKSMVRNKVQSFLEKKWKTEVQIGNIDYRLPNWIALERVLILDRKKDTLLSGGRIYVGIKLLQLLSNTVDVTGLSLENIVLNCHRTAGDSLFNYQFILDAFAPPAGKVQTQTKTAPLRLSVKQLSLHQVRFRFNDQQQQLHFSAYINELSCLPESLYPEIKTFQFKDFKLKNTEVVMIDSSIDGSVSPKTTKSRGDPAPLLLGLDQLALHNVYFSYQQPSNKIDYTFRVDSLQLQQASLDLSAQSIVAKYIQLSNTSVSLLDWIPPRNTVKKKPPSPSAATNNFWRVRVDAISLFNNSFVYSNEALPASKGLDADHIRLKKINLQTRENSFDSLGLFAAIDTLSLVFNDQFQVKHIQAGFRFSDNLIHMKDLVAAINQSYVASKGDLIWPLKTGASVVNATPLVIEKASLNYGDLLLIQPGLKKQLPFSISPSEQIIVAGRFTGTLQNLNTKQFNLSTSGRQVQVAGSMNFRLAEDGPALTATLQPLRLKKQLLSKELLQRLQKDGIRLPEDLVLTGKVHLDQQQLKTDVKLACSFGQLQIKGHANNLQQPQRLTYNFQLDAHQFETGKWIGMDSSLGKITGRLFIKGSGIQKERMIADAQLQLESAIINHYPYANIGLHAKWDRSAFTVQSSIQDPNLETVMDVSGHFSSDQHVRGNVYVKRADFLKLGFTADSLIYAGNIHIDGDHKQPNVLYAKIQGDSNLVFIRGKQIAVDSFLLTVKSDADSLLMTVQSPFIAAKLFGNYSIKALSSEMAAIWRVLYPFGDSREEKKLLRDSGGYRTSVEVKLTQDSLINAFFPMLELKQPVVIQGQYNDEHKDSLLSILVQAPNIRYGQLEGHDWRLTTKTVDSVMHFSLSGKEVFNAKNRLTDVQVTGQMQRGMLLVNGRVNDSAGKAFYAANVEVKKENDETVIRIRDDLTLNRYKWKVPADNVVRIVKGNYFINHLLLESRGQTVSIHTKDQQALSPIAVQIDSFDIKNIFALLSPGDTLGAKGILNVDISVQQPIGKIPIVTGDILASNLAVHDIPIGDLQFHSKSIGDSLVIQGGLSGMNQLKFNGNVHLVNRGVGLQVHLEKLNTELIESYAKDILTRLSGNITGDVQLAGSLDNLKFQGAIYMDSVIFALATLNTPYRINKQKLMISDSDLDFGQFVVADSAGHPLTVQGSVALFGAGAKRLDVNMETKDFMLLKASRKPGASLYGTGIVDAKVAVKGTVEEPVIEGNAYLHKNSQVYFVSTPRSSVGRTRKDGLVFVDMDTLLARKDSTPQLVSDSAIARATFKGLKYNMGLKVDKDAEISIIIDPTTDDEMVLKGDARLNAGLNENGEVGVEGVYNLQSGYYKMNNLLLRGKFMLVKGSSISFNGDPTMAEADVTTEYIIEASPKGLLNYKEDDPAYSQRTPFAVIFMIKGPISKPALSFDIKLKEGKSVLKSSVKSDVEHALDRLRSDVTEMNKQVFSLLLAKRFASTTDNNLESSNLNANNALKEGVSSFLTEAMNQVADQLIKGVDVDVNMKTYKAEDDPISKTELGVAMSKDLFQERMVIRIEESFAVGNTAPPAKSGSQYIPDITSTYKLSKDGRFQIKAYQKNEYDAVVQGYFTEIGINFTIEMAYDKFQELVRRRKRQANEKQ
ncbi:translocation/assembly module TamB domain-containing protein [Flavisolibacter tropicus]|uniref:Translocation and assembly module TamB C-terminal domain-containing protein n=1 Tax=Flavisolibacter tropicus TaxID=1492898 RepID=A0A172TVR9_9BACT|nr:translocation/assembly module TamB domain-containing protein [Flavisolibacter tropicus]ANE50837.1 hypothetical protein SY85_10280 [Flavisolibacter tropicus]